MPGSPRVHSMGRTAGMAAIPLVVALIAFLALRSSGRPGAETIQAGGPVVGAVSVHHAVAHDVSKALSAPSERDDAKAAGAVRDADDPDADDPD